MLQKNAVTEIPPGTPGFYSNIFLVRKASGEWHPDLNRFKTTESQQYCTSLSHAHHKLSTEYHRKSRLRIRNRLAGCVLSSTCTSDSRKYLHFAFENKVYQFRFTSLWSELCPSGIFSSGHTVAAYLHCQGISVFPYLNDWLEHHCQDQGLFN